MIQIINEFAENLDADLSHIKNSMAEHRKSADLHFGGLKAHIGDLGVELRRAMVVMSSDITVRSRDSCKTVLTGAGLYSGSEELSKKYRGS